MKREELRVGVDTGGTFTDIVFRLGEDRGRLKLLSTPADPGAAVLEGLATLFPERAPDLLTYGTTVATNAMLERRGARTALVTTAGFEDVLAIGRQARPDLYALEPARPEPLVPARLRFGLRERTLFDGSVLTAPAKKDIAALVARLRRAKVESIAVCFLHAPACPDHERQVAEALAPLGLPVTVSSELSPEAGEFERTSTVVANAFVRPKVERHIADLAARSRARRFRVMQSSGGAIGAKLAATEPIRTMLSGPAGGVAAAALLAEELGIERLVTFDMGGTSTDVALVAGGVPRRSLTMVGGIPVRSPSIDIHTVGAGGGSIAWVDEGGSLKVGPESAGADPGPACYGKGRDATVTDANLVLGRLLPDRFLGGTMALGADRAEAALARLARAMKAGDPGEAAEGVARVVEGNMERAVRVITVERGEDPRTCSLAAFGGAAAVHACALAEALGMKEVVVPRDPGLFSATGVLDGPVLRERTAALPAGGSSRSALDRLARGLRRDVEAEVRREGFAAGEIATELWVRIRYVGQSGFLEVEPGDDLRGRFEELHRRRFHAADPERAIEVVGLRVVARGEQAQSRRPQPARRRPAHRKAPPALATTEVRFEGRARKTPVYERDDLTPGVRLAGPVLIAEYSSTVWLPPGWSATVTAGAHLLCGRQEGSRS